MAIKTAIANNKGGIGKTTTALCLADALRLRGNRVLLIDTDPQQSSTGVYGAKTENAVTLADVIYAGENASDCIQHLKMGDIIASDTALSEADTQIKADADMFYHIKDHADALEDLYDYIIIDCPPGKGVILGSVLTYCDNVIMPITCDKFGVQGMVDFNQELAKYKKRINPGLNILGVLMIKYKNRQSLTRDLEEELLPKYVSEMKTRIFDTKIRESVKCQEAQALGVSLFEYAPKSTTAEDYVNLAEEYLKAIGKEH